MLNIKRLYEYSVGKLMFKFQKNYSPQVFDSFYIYNRDLQVKHPKF